ncbi:hypothetical protein MMC30_006409 [Trapelia coarctata]|nr:hypothetical protein [Trapelia coarctata]
MSSTTPQRSPVRKRPILITQGQKQALIDNLQLEITERARKLRAQFALQTQSLRTRVELRVNRIPKTLRSARMGDLLLKHAESMRQQEMAPAMPTSQPAPAEATRKGTTANEPKAIMLAAATQPCGTKRTSDTMIAADKENTPDTTQPFPHPKKRTKTAAVVQSRQVTNPSCVLSPKSSNSRTLPPSPVRPPLDSRQKPHLSRPTSPLKPASSIKMASPAKTAVLAATTTLAHIIGEKPKSGRAVAPTDRKASKPVVEPKASAARPKRGAPAGPTATETRIVSSSSNTSATSTGTTVVKSKARAPPAAKAPAKKGVGVSAAGKKMASAKTEVPTTGRRVLRARA